jgi:hypothetical protein
MNCLEPPAVMQVRALHNFNAPEVGELPFMKGDIIKVLRTTYQHWWFGEANGLQGIFPVNYVVSNQVHPA